MNFYDELSHEFEDTHTIEHRGRLHPHRHIEYRSRVHTLRENPEAVAVIAWAVCMAFMATLAVTAILSGYLHI